MFRKPIITLIWLVIWQLISTIMGLDLVLSSPVKVLFSMFTMLGTSQFYIALGCSVARFLLGFIIAGVLGIVLGYIAFSKKLVEEFLAPVVYLTKSMPVVCFIILLLIWFGSEWNSMIVAAIVTFPVIYSGVIQGLGKCDKSLLEMAKIFDIKGFGKFRYIYSKYLIDGFIDSAKVGIGMCFKAGAAAEVIALPTHGVGSQMYLSKLYLETPQLVAWGIWLIVVAALIEKIIVAIAKVWARRIAG